MVPITGKIVKILGYWISLEKLNIEIKIKIKPNKLK